MTDKRLPYYCELPRWLRQLPFMWIYGSNVPGLYKFFRSYGHGRVDSAVRAWFKAHDAAVLSNAYLDMEVPSE